LQIDQIIAASLVDLGTAVDAQYTGVLAPSDERDRLGTGVTRQFLEDASSYHQKYFDIGYSNYMLSIALDAIKIDVHPDDLILDIGSGSGPSVFALMNSFPECHVVATDISPDLLAILRTCLSEKGRSDKCTTLCLDLNRQWFHGQPFQLAVGSAILHHLFEPEQLITAVFSAVRKGGAVVFFEPFEPGYAMMAMIYRMLLAQSSLSRPLSVRLAEFFRNKLAETAKMKCEAKDRALYAEIDDKWLFTRSYFSEIADRVGAAQMIIRPLNVSETPFTNHLQVMLRLGLDMQPADAPAWIWELVAEQEASLSSLCKRDLFLEGCVAFVK
jgi:ubiquinone/menaquinone biosynthesis C-methylase UbiE